MRALFLLLSCLLLYGCGTTNDAPKSDLLFGRDATRHEKVLQRTRLAPDPHSGWTNVLGPVVIADWARNRRYVILSWIDPNRPETDNTFQLQVEAGFSRRVYLKQAYAEGRKLTTKVIDRERTDCGYQCHILETVWIALSETDMARYAQTGLAFEVIGRRETIAMTIPAAYFAALLEFHRREWKRIHASGPQTGT